MKKKTSLEVPKELWSRFKILCIKKEKVMARVIEGLIREWISQNE